MSFKIKITYGIFHISDWHPPYFQPKNKCAIYDSKWLETHLNMSLKWWNLTSLTPLPILENSIFFYFFEGFNNWFFGIICRNRSKPHMQRNDRDMKMVFESFVLLWVQTFVIISKLHIYYWHKYWRRMTCVFWNHKILLLSADKDSSGSGLLCKC